MSLGAVAVLFATAIHAAGADSPKKIMEQVLEALESARLGEAASLIQGNERLLESPLALSLLGQILECGGREAEALEVYLLLHARVGGAVECGFGDRKKTICSCTPA